MSTARILPLTVVADRHCATSRTYLTYLSHAGWCVAKVLLVDFLWTDTRAARLRSRLGERIGSWAMQRLEAPPPPFSDSLRTLCSEIQKAVPIPIDYFAEFDFARHTVEVERFVATDYDDPALHRRLRAQRCRVFLYTNGGRVPRGLLEDTDLRFLHVHPGVVPHVRGSDGLLWSMLVRGRPGASCFYMDAGIDTGRILLTKEFDKPYLPCLHPYLERDSETIYRALLHGFDPHLRAAALLGVVERAKGTDLGRLPAQDQSPSEGRSFYWMHPRLRARVFRDLAERGKT